MAIHILGIRHHGPGSARNVKQFLEQIKPDIVLVEGPPEADGILQWVTDKELIPPVAILCFQPDNPQQAVFYPFAEFSRMAGDPLCTEEQYSCSIHGPARCA